MYLELLRILRLTPALACLLLTIVGSAQSVHFQRLPPDDELSQQSIRSMVQDSLGFIWLGTHGGLVKFDGFDYTFYYRNPRDSNSLVRNYISALAVDRFQPILWIGTDDGLSRLDLQTESFTNYRHDDNNPNSLAYNDLVSIAQDGEGYLWIGTLGGGLDRLNPKTGNFTHHKHDAENSNSIGGNGIMDIYSGKDGWMWYMAGGGPAENLGNLERIHPKTGKIERFEDKIGKSLSGFPHTSCQDKKGNIWTVTTKGIFYYDFERSDFVQHAFDPEKFEQQFGLKWHQSGSTKTFLADRMGRLWLSSFSYHPILIDARGNIRQIKQGEKPDELPILSIWANLEDKQGIVWLGLFQGFVKAYPVEDKFELVQFNIPIGADAVYNNIDAVAVNEQGIVYASVPGLLSPGMVSYNRNTGKTTYYYHQQNDPFSIPENWGDRIFYMGEKIWMQTSPGRRHHYRIFDPATKGFYAIPQHP